MAPVTKEITQKKAKWFEHVKRRDERHMLRRVLNAQERDREEDGQPGG